jgi:hypothetical protein
MAQPPENDLNPAYVGNVETGRAQGCSEDIVHDPARVFAPEGVRAIAQCPMRLPSNLTYKKEAAQFGYRVGKISMKEKHVTFHKEEQL